MPTDDPRVQLQAELANTIWMLRPEALEAFGLYAAGALSLDEMRRQAGLQTVEPEPGPGAIAVIGLQGLLTPKGSFLDILFGGGGGLQAFRASLAEAVNDSAVEAILIDIDSPGGYQAMTPETATAVRDARAVKPIIAIANTMAASAAYYIGSQADELVMTPSGVVGSIGVYSTHTDVSALEQRIGIKTTLISAGPYKTEGNSFAPLSAEARAAMQGDVDEMYAEFLADVAGGRGTTVDDVAAHYGQGRCLRATQALAAGAVDRVETLEQVLARLFAGDVTRKTAAPTSRARKPAPEPAAAAARPPAPTMRCATFASAPQAAAATSSSQGIAWVTGDASVYGSRNTFGEVFVPGAFRDSLTDPNPLPMVDGHRNAVGSWPERSETIEKLALAGPISDTQPGREMHTLLRDGALNGLSVAYLPLAGGVYLAAPGETVNYDTPYGPWSCTQDRWTIYVSRARLGEVSIVNAPSDEQARVTSVGAMSAEQLGTALPGLRAGAPWADVAWSMCRLMGAPGGGLTDLQPDERQALHAQLCRRYAEHGMAAPVFAARPDYRSTTFRAGEPALYQDRSLGKRCSDVVAAIGGSTGRPLSDGTRTRATEARDALNRLLDTEQTHEDLDELDTAAVVAELERALTSLES